MDARGDSGHPEELPGEVGLVGVTGPDRNRGQRGGPVQQGEGATKAGQAYEFHGAKPGVVPHDAAQRSFTEPSGGHLAVWCPAGEH